MSVTLCFELASFPCSYSTAENLLTHANVGPNDIVLVTGSSGGVGSGVIQLAKARRAQVFGITSLYKADKISELGADRTLSRNANLIQELGKDSVDVVIDLVAGNGRFFWMCLSLLAGMPLQALLQVRS